MKAVKVLKKEAEKVRKKLIELGLLDKSYSLTMDNNHILIPIKKASEKLKKFEVVDKKFKKLNKITTNLKKHLKTKLSTEELKKVKKAYDVIGDIAIIEIPDELKKKEKIIAEAILVLNKNIKVVAKKVGNFKGEFRTRDLKIIAGDRRKETVYKENAVRLKLNVETCYFSPRLSTERKRIAELVKDGEDVLVMFSGVGPYPVVLSRRTGANEVVGIEINPEAAKYAEQNAILNKCKNVRLFAGDVKKVVPSLKKKFDRILMPLPKSAEDFLDVALKALKKGGIIHFYDFLHESEIPDKVLEKIEKHVENYRVLKVIKCGQYSPKKFRVCVDFRV